MEVNKYLPLTETTYYILLSLLEPAHGYIMMQKVESGMSFWFSFLFETPFALMRGFAWTVIPITILLYLFFGYKSNKFYLQNKN